MRSNAWALAGKCFSRSKKKFENVYKKSIESELILKKTEQESVGARSQMHLKEQKKNLELYTNNCFS